MHFLYPDFVFKEYKELKSGYTFHGHVFRMFLKVPYFQLSFVYQLGFWSETFFLISLFPDHYLHLSFYTQTLT